MTKGIKKGATPAQATSQACGLCKNVRKLKGQFCRHCGTRLKQILDSKEGSDDWITATILREGRADRRKDLSKKLVRACEKGTCKH